MVFAHLNFGSYSILEAIIFCRREITIYRSSGEHFIKNLRNNRSDNNTYLIFPTLVSHFDQSPPKGLRPRSDGLVGGVTNASYTCIACA